MLFGGAGESTKKPDPGSWKGEDNYGKKAFCLEVNNNIMTLFFRNIGNHADQHILNVHLHQVLANTYSV